MLDINGYLKFVYYLGHNEAILTSMKPLLENQWNAVKVTRKANIAFLYINGTLQDEGCIALV